MSKLIKFLCFGAGVTGPLFAGSIYVLANQREEPVDLLLKELISLKNQSGRQSWLINKIQKDGLKNSFEVKENSFVDREKAKAELDNWCNASGNEKDLSLFNKYCV